MKVTPTTITIESEELVKSILNVPLYQREYSWELEEVSDLFYDIQNSDESNGHFLGSILLSAKEDNKKEIIDGQQRLTTIFLILYFIRKTLNDNNDNKDGRIPRTITRIDEIIYLRTKDPMLIEENIDPRLTTGYRDKKLFKSILQGIDSENNKKGKLKSHKLLLNAVNNFIEPKIKEINNTKGTDGLLLFFKKVVACRYIVMTAEEKEDERLLFKTLNSRGVALSESDLIKNEVCTNIKGNINENLIDDVVSLWNEIRQTLENNNINIDLFLFHYINHLPEATDLRNNIELSKNKISDSDIKSESDKLNYYPPISEKLFFSAYELKIKEIKNTIHFLESLKKSADLYVDIASPQETNKQIKDKTIIYLKGLKALNITKCYPLLLRGKSVLNDKKFEKLAQSIECLSFRHGIQKKEPKELEKFYYQLLKNLNSDGDINDIIVQIKNHNTMTDEKEFKDQFLKAAPKSSISKMILQRIFFYKQNEFLNITSKSVWFEHIMPQTPAGEWVKLSVEKEIYENMLQRLGNLTLLQYSKNIGAGNKNFSDKKVIYQTSTIELNRELLTYDTWDFDSIEKRQSDLYEIAKEIWKI